VYESYGFDISVGLDTWSLTLAALQFCLHLPNEVQNPFAFIALCDAKVLSRDARNAEEKTGMAKCTSRTIKTTSL